MPLTDTAIRNAKPSPEGKDSKMSDGGGLYLLVKANGQKYWRMNYRYLGKQKTLAIGVYPIATLKHAREARDEAKRLLLEGIDPSLHRQQLRATNQTEARNTFEIVGREWFNKRKAQWTPEYADRVLARLETYLFPRLGHRPTKDILAPELLTVLRKIEDRGVVETAHRVKQYASGIFRYGIATGRADRDPAADLKDALQVPQSKHFAFIKEPKRIGELLRMIDGYQGTAVVTAAFRLAPLLFARPTELRTMRWVELDLDGAMWRIPAEKMKMREQHLVPLSTQAVAILRDLKPLTDKGEFVFPSARKGGKAMSNNAILAALRTMGIPKEEMSGHGFRHTASTLLHELGWNSDVIERQLAHDERDKSKATYNHAQHLPERVKMMQAWADYLDQLKTRTDTSGS